MSRMAEDIESSFDSAFSREILRSEVRRASVLVFIFIVGAMTFLLQPILFPAIFKIIYSEGFPIWLPPAYFLLIATYAFLLRMYFKRTIRLGLGINPLVRYGSAFVEATIPTLAIFELGANAHNSIEALDAPPSFVYFLFIIISTLRLEERMSIFSGIVSSIQYVCLFLYFKTFSFNALPATLVENDALFYAKAFILLGSGFVAGFVTRQIKRAVSSSFRHEVDKNQIRALFGQHVSPEVVNQLLEQKDEWEGETRHVCMLFFDIRNFTQFSESQSPTNLIQFLNTVFTSSIECVNSNGGIINKFLGDGFMAVFGAPVSDGRDVHNAIKAAEKIKITLDGLISAGKLPKIGFGMGLHAGNAVTGNVGSNERKEYTIIGDVVNLAARIEQLNKQFETEILVSEEVVNQNTEQKERYHLLGDVMIKGKSQPVKIFKFI
ncbi:adenylate/guanylate cyclase domain-containing protein [Leptospira ognonensis]|uniref:Adenylate/guanylate cyclase domain-containing protein n=2 Tax=Leptospira ognonensis TaxID=2484945 RepID=A0A4R9K6Q4_9LEPT|nr:adenylate/guanylate cyclase domain-containing protein [Leptospira ognonensis]